LIDCIQSNPRRGKGRREKTPLIREKKEDRHGKLLGRNQHYRRHRLSFRSACSAFFFSIERERKKLKLILVVAAAGRPRKGAGAGPSASSSRVSSASVPATPRCEEGEILQSPNVRSFTFNELKTSTRNFRPDSVLGEGGFGSVFKGWIDENTFAPARPGTGMAIAVKKLNQEGFQGHREWLVRTVPAYRSVCMY
jgi:hypothetical protein